MDEDIMFEYATIKEHSMIPSSTKRKHIKDQELEQLNECYALFKQYVKSSQSSLEERAKVLSTPKRPVAANELEKSATTTLRRKPIISKFLNHTLKRGSNRNSRKNNSDRNNVEDEISSMETYSTNYKKKNYLCKLGGGSNSRDNSSVIVVKVEDGTIMDKSAKYYLRHRRKNQTEVKFDELCCTSRSEIDEIPSVDSEGQNGGGNSNYQPCSKAHIYRPDYEYNDSEPTPETPDCSTNRRFNVILKNENTYGIANRCPPHPPMMMMMMMSSSSSSKHQLQQHQHYHHTSSPPSHSNAPPPPPPLLPSLPPAVVRPKIALRKNSENSFRKYIQTDYETRNSNQNYGMSQNPMKIGNKNVTNNNNSSCCVSKKGHHGNNAIVLLYKGPEPTPPFCNMRLYDMNGPVSFLDPPLQSCAQHQRAELRAWYNISEVIISQNSSKRRVLRGIWLSPLTPSLSYPVAIKSVEDQNSRDGRSVKREIECHLYIYSKLSQIQLEEKYNTLTDSWPSSELFGYYLDKDNPGKCLLITRKLSGPDFFDVIRQEHVNMSNLGITYEYHKLNWCILALKRIIQYGKLGIRHNDIKPDNIVLDFYENNLHEKLLDVKIIDLGTASMHTAKEFTGGTSWYESPEQKILEYYSKKIRDAEKAKMVDIGLNSDVWAAGLSITEVLLGKRVVDYLKQPNGPGPLDYRGPEVGWTVEPNIWVSIARKALLSKSLDNDNQVNYYSYEAAKYIFDHLVKPNPKDRAKLSDAINQLYYQTRKILEKIRKTT